MDEKRADDLSPAVPLEEETFAFPFLKDDSLKSKQIGPYDLLEVLGEGGMGVVYLAEQREPIERRVALKVIKLGMDSKQVIARFESERQALALMNHPHIAKVLDAGTTKEGRPYFVMEYVEGTSITTYCNTQRLGARERLELMLPVCQAVHHAHQKGIIHRDLKPSNILVSVEDGRPQPKVIDFGVAKATQHRLTEKTLVTQQGFRLGTPGYMSPEQAEITGMDIDTTTDVYSLGVVLYSLLTGVLPFDREQLLEGGYSEMQRIIREEEPLKPSTRVKALGEKATDIARARQTNTRSLTKNLRGDLDWITLKCLEKDRTRRYQSAAELAADLQRHLRDEPVLASPPSTAYRMKKFVLRHKVGVVAGALVVLALALGIAGTTVGMLRALRAEAEASTQADIASREADAAQQVSDFLVNLFKVSDPSESLGNSITAREILDAGARAGCGSSRSGGFAGWSGRCVSGPSQV